MLLGLRFLLGASEAGLYPGVVFYLSWYCCTSMKHFQTDQRRWMLSSAGINVRSLVHE